MEDYLVILSIALIGVFALMGMKMFKPNDNRKQRKVDATDIAQKEVITSKDMTITTLRDELRSVMGKLTRSREKEPDFEEELAENGSKQVTWDEIQALVKTQAPKYSALLPLVKKQVLEATKGMTMGEILQYVKQFKGDPQSQGLPTQDTAGYNPNWA